MVARLGLAGRLILFGALAASVVALAGGLILRNGLHQAMRHGFELRLAEHAEIITARLTAQPDESGFPATYLEPRGGDEFGRIFSGWYWRLSTQAQTLRSRSLWDADISASTLVHGQRLNARGPQGEALFGIVQDISLPELEPLRLEVFGPAAPVLDELRIFDRQLLLVLAGLLLALSLMTLLQVRLGLRPLARLRHALAEVESGTRSRIGQGFGPDLEPMAAELDDLLARNARIVARARSHAADLAHALKKPLALLRSEADSGEQVSAALVREQGQTMLRLTERHLARAGSGAGEHRRILMRPHLEALQSLMRQLHAVRALDWQLDVPATLAWRGESTDLEEMLGNLMDNAGKWAGTQVRITALAGPELHARASEHDSEPTRRRGVLIRVEDDGPGLSDADLAVAAQRWQRFDESVEGSGLGLAITADIAETYGGHLHLARSVLGGLLAELWLPD